MPYDEWGNWYPDEEQYPTGGQEEWETSPDVTTPGSWWEPSVPSTLSYGGGDGGRAIARSWSQYDENGQLVEVDQYSDGSYGVRPVYGQLEESFRPPAAAPTGAPTMPVAPRPTATPNPNLNAMLAALTAGSRGGARVSAAPGAALGLEAQMLQAAAQQAYLRERLRMLEIPEMMNLDERERHRIAMDYAARFSQLTGYAVPYTALEQSMARYTGFGGQGISAQDMTEIRRQLQGAGWQGGGDEEAIAAYLRTVAPGTNAELLARIQQAQQPTRVPGQPLPTDWSQYPRTLEREAFEHQRDTQLAEMAANPRSLAQSLFMMGMSEPQVGEFLQEQPLVQRLTQGGYLSNLNAQGRNPNFQFIGGHQMPAREALSWGKSNSQNIPLVSGLASFSGQDPEEWWGQFKAALPQGAVAGLTRI